MRQVTGVRAIITTLSAAALALVLALGMQAQLAGASPPTNTDWAPFGTGTWVNGQGDVSKFGLVTTSNSSGTYGGIQLKAKDVPSDPAEITALSFDFMANQTGASGGSPRLVVEFSDGGNGQLRPLAWVAGDWTLVNGMLGNNWDNQGGTCGFQYATTWSDIVACHAGATITAIFVVNDSGWAYPTTGEQVILDNITVNDLTATGPGIND